MAGWLIFRNINRLGHIVCGWKWQLAAGVLLTVPYYFHAQYVNHNGYATWNYPKLAVEDIRFDHARGTRAYEELRMDTSRRRSRIDSRRPLEIASRSKSAVHSRA